MGVNILQKKPLPANVSYTQSLQDRFHDTRPVGCIRGEVYADQAGTLYLEESDDSGTTWSTTATVSVTAGVTTPLTWTKLTKRWYRFRYANGAAAQGSFVLLQHHEGPDFALLDGDGKALMIADANLQVGDADVDATNPVPTTLTGSNVPDDESLPTKTIGAITNCAPTKCVVGTSSTLALPVNTERKYVLFINDSDAVIYIKLGSAAVVSEGIRINANGGSYEMSNALGNLFTGEIYAISDVAGKYLLVNEGRKEDNAEDIFYDTFTQVDNAPLYADKWLVTNGRSLVTATIEPTSKIDIQGNVAQVRVSRTSDSGNGAVEKRAKALTTVDFTSEKRIISWKMTPYIENVLDGITFSITDQDIITDTDTQVGGADNFVRIAATYSTEVIGRKINLQYRVNGGAIVTESYDYVGEQSDMDSFVLEITPSSIRLLHNDIEKINLTELALGFTYGWLYIASSANSETLNIRDFDDIGVK